MKKTKNTSFRKIICFVTIQIAFLATLDFEANGQINPVPTMFWNQYTYFNPAASGLFYKHEGIITGHEQRTTLTTGNPRTLFARYNARVNALHGGLGLDYAISEAGYMRENHLRLNYSFHIKLGEKSTLAAGLSVGIYHARLDPSLFSSLPYNNYAFPKGATFALNTGLVFKTDKLSIGISADNVLTARKQGHTYTPYRNYYLLADYTFRLGSNFQLKPQVHFMTDMQFHLLSGNLLGIYKEKYWIGASYRSNERFAFMGGWDILGKFRIGYAYQLPHDMMFESHEVVLGILLK